MKQFQIIFLIAAAAAAVAVWMWPERIFPGGLNPFSSDPAPPPPLKATGPNYGNDAQFRMDVAPEILEFLERKDPGETGAQTHLCQLLLRSENYLGELMGIPRNSGWITLTKGSDSLRLLVLHDARDFYLESFNGIKVEKPRFGFTATPELQQALMAMKPEWDRAWQEAN